MDIRLSHLEACAGGGGVDKILYPAPKAGCVSPQGKGITSQAVPRKAAPTNQG